MELPVAMRNSKGFTLIEILIVFAILGILAAVTFGNFQTAVKKARDAQRKADLSQLRNALEAYQGDHGAYPSAGTGANAGKILACGCRKPPLACEWGIAGSSEFCDENNTVYMSGVPKDPGGSASPSEYCYQTSGTSFQIYANLENTNDPEATPGKTCGGFSTYNFGLSSSNTTP